LDVPYFRVVFTLPARIAAIAYQNKAVVYDLLFKASSQTMRTIAADPKRLGVKIGFTSVLHTWGSAMTHHPHVHMIVPGGGISLDGKRWISCRSKLPLAGEGAVAAVPPPDAGDAARRTRRRPPASSSATTPTSPVRPRSRPISRRCIGPSGSSIASGRSPGRSRCWPICPANTHRVAISNSRLIAADATGVTFSYKDYRIEGPGRYKTMRLKPDEFIRRFLMHVLPNGFHRIRHCGLLASAPRRDHRADP